MSQTSQLYTLTPNVKTQISVTGQANRVRVVNDSSLYLRVYFGADAPIGPNDPGWHDTISPGDKPLLWITGGTGQTWWAQSGNASSTPFTGVITFLPFFPVGATLASGGVVSGASILYITAFSPDENADRGGQTEAFVQAAKQARNQIAGLGGVLRSPQMLFTDATIAGDVVLPGLLISNTPILQANAVGTSVVNLYLYGMYISFRNKSVNTAGMLLSPQFALTDTLGSTTRDFVSVYPWETFLQASNYGTMTREITQVYPILAPFSIPQNQLNINDHVVFRYQILESYGHWDMRMGFLYLMDRINQSTLQALASYPFASDPAWNATYNPQTY